MKKRIEIKELNRVESMVLSLLWDKKKASSREIREELITGDFAYSTLSLYLRLLENKGFIGHEKIGNTYHYFSKVSRDEYLETFFDRIAAFYFQGNKVKMLTFFEERLNK